MTATGTRAACNFSIAEADGKRRATLTATGEDIEIGSIEKMSKSKKNVVDPDDIIASYGADLPGRPSLGAAVRRLLASVPELPRLRLSSLDPAALDDELWRLLAEEPRLMPHLHLSLQHGAELILKRMKRRHGRADALLAARRARDARPGIALGADLIAGFPTETEAHLRDTLDLIEEMGLSFLHVFPYSDRPGTVATALPDKVHGAVVRERAAIVRGIGRDLNRRFHREQDGSIRPGLTIEDGTLVVTDNYLKVRIPEGLPRNERVDVALSLVGDELVGRLSPTAVHST